MKILLDQGADPNKGSRGVRSQGCVLVGVPPDDQLSNPLHAVAGFRSLHSINRPSFPTKQPEEHELIQAEECCRLLLDAGCNPNATGYRGYTPLHISAGSKLITVAKAILENGADPFIATNTGTTPLHLLAPFKESIPMIKLLTSRGLKLDKTYSSDGSAPIHDIFNDDHQLDLKLLAPYVTDWNAVDKKRETLLHQLMRCRKSPSRVFVASLIDLGADVRRKNLGLESIHIAASTYGGSVPMPGSPGLAPIIQLLVASGADIEARDSKGLTPFHHLIISGTKRQDKGLEISSFTRQFQPNIHAIDNDGNGVLHFALQDGQPNGFLGRAEPWTPDIKFARHGGSRSTSR
jgi:ankyrin repeat protein